MLTFFPISFSHAIHTVSHRRDFVVASFKVATQAGDYGASVSTHWLIDRCPREGSSTIGPISDCVVPTQYQSVGIWAAAAAAVSVGWWRQRHQIRWHFDRSQQHHQQQFFNGDQQTPRAYVHLDSSLWWYLNYVELDSSCIYNVWSKVAAATDTVIYCSGQYTYNIASYFVEGTIYAYM